MSTKIYNGVVFKSNSMEEILKEFIKIKDIAIKEHNKNLTIEDIIFFIKYKELEDKTVCEIFSKLQENIDERFRRITDVNFNFSIVLFPHKDKIYGIYFTDYQDEDSELLSELIEDYHYQDQCDKPEHIPYDEWEERRETWDELIGYDSISDRGFSYTFCSGKDLDIIETHNKIKEAKEKIEEYEKQHN